MGLYIIVAALPDADGIGIIQSIGDTTIDLCYRIHSDGSIYASGGEFEEFHFPIHLEFNRQGEMEKVLIGHVAEYRVWSFDDHYLPSEELNAYSLCMAKTLS